MRRIGSWIVTGIVVWLLISAVCGVFFLADLQREIDGIAVINSHAE